jgi:two-component sensor histidine kinase
LAATSLKPTNSVTARQPLLPRNLDLRTANAISLGIRELLINAVEHGCLEIGFDLKTKIAESKDYLEFLARASKTARIPNAQGAGRI